MGLEVVPVHEPLHEDEPLLLGDVERPLDRLDAAVERLLAEDVLAVQERADAPVRMERVRQRDVDRVDVPVGEQRLVGAVRPLDSVLARVRVRARLLPARDRDDVDGVRVGRAPEDRPVDPSRREEAEPQQG
jgi:hypothetical protein